jgi:periplasmic protein TonB
MKSTFLLTAVVLFTILHCSAQSEDTATYSDRTYTKVEVEASYPGGDHAWLTYLNHTLRYPDDAVNNEIKGTVVVQFIVNIDSTISDVQAISGPKKGGLREESVRVITLSGKWVPAMENGRLVRSYKKQPLVFKLEVYKR